MPIYPVIKFNESESVANIKQLIATVIKYCLLNNIGNNIANIIKIIDITRLCIAQNSKIPEKKPFFSFLGAVVISPSPP